MKTITKKLMVLILVLLVMGACSNKGDNPPAETEEAPVEESSGFSFSMDEDLRLVQEEGRIYLMGDRVRELDQKSGKLSESNFHDYLYRDKGFSYDLKDGSLFLYEGGEDRLLAQEISDFKSYEDRLLYSDDKGVFMLQYSRKIPQLLKGRVPGETNYKFEDFNLIDGGKFFIYYNEEDVVTEIYLTETLDHVTDFDGRVSATSWSNDSFLFEDQGGHNRIGYYKISTEEISKFNLTTDDERVIQSPGFDDKGLIRFVSDKNGVFSLNKLDPQSQTVKKINMMRTEDLLEEAQLDGYYLFRFKSYFFYSKDDRDYHFYALESDRVNFSDSYIFVVNQDGLKIVQKDSYKSYSLKGKPKESLGTDKAFYYTYDRDGKSWLDWIEIDF